MNLHAALVQTAFFHAKELLCNVSLRVIANKLQQHLRWDNSNQLSTFGAFILALPEVHPDVPSTSWTRFITTINDTDGVNKRSERGAGGGANRVNVFNLRGETLDENNQRADVSGDPA